MAATAIDDIILRFKDMASRCRVLAPRDIAYVLTTHSRADPAAGNLLPGSDAPAGAEAPVVVVTGQGEFVGFRRPPGARPPTGTHLMVTFMRRDGAITGYSISNLAPDLSALGDPVTL